MLLFCFTEIKFAVSSYFGQCGLWVCPFSVFYSIESSYWINYVIYEDDIDIRETI